VARDADGQIGSISDAELEKAKEVVQSLRVLRTRYLADWSPPVELFVPNPKLDLESRRTNERKVKFFNQTALWHGLLLKQEFKLKLLSCLDGYLAAVDSENPVLVYLSARYLLELVATIAYLDFELREALKANAGDWEGRGVRFVTTLCRGRYASSDPKMADVLQTFGTPKKAVKPIGIEPASAEHFQQCAEFLPLRNRALRSGYYCLEDKAIFKRATEDYLVARVTRTEGTVSSA
jgi:hypothetical protein